MAGDDVMTLRPAFARPRQARAPRVAVFRALLWVAATLSGCAHAPEPAPWRYEPAPESRAD
jgi:hypothetical protein